MIAKPSFEKTAKYKSDKEQHWHLLQTSVAIQNLITVNTITKLDRVVFLAPVGTWKEQWVEKGRIWLTRLITKASMKRPLQRVRRLIPFPARVTATSAAAIRVLSTTPDQLLHFDPHDYLAQYNTVLNSHECTPPHLEQSSKWINHLYSRK